MSAAKTCRLCVYPAHHPLGLTLDADGVCSGCRVHREKDTLDWNPRREKLRRILDSYRVADASRHDCIIPVTGARDSFFIVDLVKNEFGMNPLLVSFNRHYNTAAGIFNLEQLRSQTGCDMVTLTLNPDVYKRLIRYSVRKIGSVHWPYLAGSTVFPVQTAVRKQIPLIIWGAHQGVDQVGMFSHLDEVEMTRRYRREHDLMGVEPEDAMADVGADLKESDLKPLFYPDDAHLESVGVRGIYLNNFIRWDTKAQHEAMIAKYDYYTGEQLRTFDTYNDVDCRIFSSLHDDIKRRKWGYGRIHDHVSREIRLGRLTRAEGLALLAAYIQKGDIAEQEKECCAWIGMDVGEFKAAIDAHAHQAPDMSEPATASPIKDLGFLHHTPTRMNVQNPEAPRLLMKGEVD
jgi:N-acetyl sugar amidotransferase